MGMRCETERVGPLKTFQRPRFPGYHTVRMPSGSRPLTAYRTNRQERAVYGDKSRPPSTRWTNRPASSSISLSSARVYARTDAVNSRVPFRSMITWRVSNRPRSKSNDASSRTTVPSSRACQLCDGNLATRLSRLNSSMRNFPRGRSARAIPRKTWRSSSGRSKYPNDVNIEIAASKALRYAGRRIAPWAGKILPRLRSTDLGPGLGGHGRGEMLEVGDDRMLPAVLEELDDRLDLRAHAPRRELALGEVLFRLRDRHSIEEPLVRLAEIQGDLGDVRRDHEVLPSDRFRQDGGREVLVDHRLDADQLAILADDRDPTATRRDHDASLAVADERADDVLLDDVHRPRRWHDSPPAAPLVVHHLPTF